MTKRLPMVAALAAVALATSVGLAEAGSIIHRADQPLAGESRRAGDLIPAHSWHRHWNHGPVQRLNLTPNQVRRILRQRGYRHMRFTDRRGRIYRLRALSPRGYPVRLVVSARNARILRREFIYAIY